jgi:uncharacterized protein (DUF1015 family)
MPALPDLVAPFRGERYAAAATLSSRIAPPYDVIPPEGRAALAARDAHNIVHVMLPEAPERGDKYAHAARLLAAWRAAGVLARDAERALYVMAQTFALPSGERRTRTGVFAAVAAEGYEPRRILPHERTHAAPKADRLALLRATRTNVESIFLLAPDRDGALTAALAGVTSGPPAATAELDDVAIQLWVVIGADASRLPLPASPLYVADGHHRYETASAYAKEQPTAGRLLAFIVSVRDPGLEVLATHRIIYGGGRSLGALLERWKQRFEVEQLQPFRDPMPRLAAARDRTACVVAWPGGQEFLLTLRPDADLAAFIGVEPAAVRDLDVARVDALVTRAIVESGDSTVTLAYSPDSTKALDVVRAARSASVAVLLNPTRVEQVFAVADARGVMPPKSTYFVPKVPSGVVLMPVD